jgi:CubicO group peptidase (beta-lactamase class C family)
MMLLAALLSLAYTVSARSNRRQADTTSTDPLLLSNSVGSDCAPAGADFPAPQLLSTSQLVASAGAEFQALLSNASLGLAPNDTAFSVVMFSSKENKTLYEYYYTPEMDVGVSSVDRDSVFRIASVSKVFTVWAFLVGAGDASFNDPITKYVPELAQALASPPTDSNVVYDDINDVRWDDVTIGDLASQSAGIPRDGKLKLNTTTLDRQTDTIVQDPLETSAVCHH